jgi:flagellin-like hook-associated protein FlgL
MSGIVLSASTRQSLLSAQDTAALLSQTQNRLATGKKVNSALDNPTNFFTASGLDSRAGDLSNLLDSISNGVQTINAASQGITNIQKLVDSAKSTAQQALATTITTVGTASSAFSAQAATIAFSVNGSTKTTTALTTSSTIDDAIAALNTAAGSNIFGKDTSGTKITVNGTGKVEFGTTEGAKIGLASVATDDTTTSYYVESNNSADLKINGLDTRANLAQQYNDLLGQIDQLAKDASFNGVNLISAKDSASTPNKLHIQFNGDDSSSIDVKGVDATSTGLKLSLVGNGPSAAFSDNTAIKTTLTSLNTATTNLRTYASQLGSNLTVVQNRQDFTKNLVNVLQTGAGNLVNADLNEEAANSQALSTRQSLAISSLSLANQAQQGVLQLLR